ncbi:MAG TPA: hypothetical protein VK849_03255, partial [Longimicrobiales bacterium]|nr:hypothetical protein [Longimicrobiales bacterium]
MTTRIDLPAGFASRHLGPDSRDVERMLGVLGYDSLDALVDDVVPDAIRHREALDLPDPLPESRLLDRLRALAGRNRVFRSYIGMGYHGTLVPG